LRKKKTPKGEGKFKKEGKFIQHKGHIYFPKIGKIGDAVGQSKRGTEQKVRKPGKAGSRSNDVNFLQKKAGDTIQTVKKGRIKRKVDLWERLADL